MNLCALILLNIFENGDDDDDDDNDACMNS